MQNNMYSGIGQNPEDDAFQRRLVNMLYSQEPTLEKDYDYNGRWTGYRYAAPEPRLGPNTRMMAYARSTPDNTNILDRASTGWNIRGLYSPRSNEGLPRSTLSRRAEEIFPNYNPSAGALNAAGNPSTVSHEMLHRLQDVAPRVIEGELEARLDGILAGIGRNDLDNRHLLNIRSRAKEILPHAINGFASTPRSLLDRFGIDPARVHERFGNQTRGDIVGRQVRELIEEVYTRSIGRAEYERASRRLEPPVTRGRGRPTYE